MCVWERSNPGGRTANAKALGQKHASGAFEEQRGGQCGFIGVLDREIRRKWVKR